MGDIEKLTVCAINAVIAKGNDGMARTELIGLPHKVWRSNQRSRVTFQYRLNMGIVNSSDNATAWS